MAFYIVQQPPPLAPARSPVRLVLSDPDYIVNAGVLSTFLIQFTGGSVANETIRFHYGTVDLTMRCSATALEDGVSWPAQADATSSAAAFATACNRNYFLYRDFIITVSGNIVYGTARNKDVLFGDDGGIELAAASTGLFNWTLGHAVEYHDQHYVGLAVHVEDPVNSGTYKRLPDQAAYHTPDNAIVSFDVSSWLKPYLAPDPIAYGLTTAVPCNSSCRRYYMAYWGRYKSAVQGQQAERAVFTTSPAFAFLGGYERTEYARFWAWWAQTSSSVRPFLTYRGRVEPREVTQAERHYLNFYNTYNPSPVGAQDRIALNVKAHYNGTPDSAWAGAYSVPRTSIPMLSCWAVGHDAINVPAVLSSAGINPAGMVAYSVMLSYVDTGLKLTEFYRFDLVQPEYQEVFIQWVNSLGAWESTRFTGTWAVKRNADFAQQQHTYPYDKDSDPAAVERTSEPVGALDTLTVNSGLNGIHEHTCLLDILNAPAIRLVDLEHGRFIPLHITDSTELPVAGLGEEDENIHQISITFAYSNANVNNTVVP
jgi:hypothetical protein